MKRLTPFILLIVFLHCENKSHFIPPEKMEKIMWEMLMADRFSYQFILKDSGRLDPKRETFKLYEQVFHINDVSRKEFEESYRHYLGQPKAMKTIVDSLAARAGREQHRVYVQD